MYKKLLNRNLKYFPNALKLSIKKPYREFSSNVGDNNEKHLQSLDIDRATTLVIGGGIIGASTAYHLAKQGEKDVVVLEKSELTAGSTWHAAGLTTFYHPSINVKKLHYYSLNMYSKICAETEQDVGFHQPGSIRIATTKQVAQELKYQKAKSGIQDAPMCLLSPEEVKEKVPIIDKDKVLLGLFTPSDGHIDPYSLTHAIAKGARKFGASIKQGIEVTSLNLREDGKWLVGTCQGTIVADRVVNAAGFWAKEVGRLAGLELPLVPMEHQYLITSPVPEIQALKSEFPVLRLLEASCYVRQERGGFLIGPYETQNKSKFDWVQNGVPKGFGKELFPSEIDRMIPHLERVMDVLPSFASANIQTIVNGPITYTPDVLPIIGPSLLPNFWLAVGFGYGIIHGGGAGKFLADWIQTGEPRHDLIECDPGRFDKWATDNYVDIKARESYAMNNSITYPFEERFAGRPTSRVSTAYNKQNERGATMVNHAGWEHPGWFASPGQSPGYEPSFGRTNWHSAVKDEWDTVKKKVGVIDLTPFAKFILEGENAEQFLDYVTANRVPKLGRSVVTHLLTPSAKVYAELTITRTEQDKFFIVTGSGSEIHDLRWLLEIARNGKWKVNIQNVTEDFGCLSVAGPKSNELLAKLNSRFQKKFPFFTSDKVDIAGIECLALRLTYTGELGYELYHPRSDTGKLYDAILEAGQPLGIGDFGSLALNVLRLEKGFRVWGKEMNLDKTIVEAGLMNFVDMNKKDFIGKGAIEEIRKEFSQKELVILKVDKQSQYDPFGDESVWLNGKVVGSTTSGCFSYHLNQPIAFAYLPPYHTRSGAEVQVEMMNELYWAEVLPRSPDLSYNEKLASKNPRRADNKKIL